MENEKDILTGKSLNAAKEKIKDEEVEKILKNAREQIAPKGGKEQRKNDAKDMEKGSADNAKEKISKERKTLKTLEERAEKEQEKFRIEDEVYVDNSRKPTAYERERISARRVISSIFEGIWTGVKLIVVIGIITAVIGFLLSRSLMIRGRNGNRECMADMKVSGAVITNKSAEDEKVRDWLQTVKREKLTMEADDKSILVARQIITKEEGNKWAVILHGYNGSMEDVYDIAMHYAEEGYNILTPDLRANGESEGSFLGMGWLDRLDIINWIDIILQKNPSAEVVVHGVDIGADAALMLSGEPIKSSIKAIVAEGAYTNAWDVTKAEYKARHEKLPVFPFLHMMNPVMKVWAGYSLKEADAVKQVKNAAVPILLIHGQNDTYATQDMTEELNTAIASPHEILTITTGTHEDCRYAEPDNYYNKTFEFIGSYID